MPPKLQGVKITGYTETVALLKNFDNEALKVMNKEIYQVMKTTQLDARSQVPGNVPSGLSSWGKSSGGAWGVREYRASGVRMGIKTKIDRQRVKGMWTSKTAFITQSDAAGAIYETAGRKNPQGQPHHKVPKGQKRGGAVKGYSNSNNPEAGYWFNKQIAKQSGLIVRGKQGRIVTKTVEDRAPYIENEMRDVINRATVKLNAKLAK
jgi:hypothetical protein